MKGYWYIMFDNGDLTSPISFDTMKEAMKIHRAAGRKVYAFKSAFIDLNLMPWETGVYGGWE